MWRLSIWSLLAITAIILFVAAIAYRQPAFQTKVITVEVVLPDNSYGRFIVLSRGTTESGGKYVVRIAKFGISDQSVPADGGAIFQFRTESGQVLKETPQTNRQDEVTVDTYDGVAEGDVRTDGYRYFYGTEFERLHKWPRSMGLFQRADTPKGK